MLIKSQIAGPHLVIAPSTTLYNWKHELKVWAPYFNVVVY